jgi:arylsulfatase A-like enzyme
MPTVLDLLGMGRVFGDGLSLLPAIQGAARVPDRLVYAESWYPRRFRWSPLRALRDGRFKLIDAPRPELYDLEADPFELHNVYADRPALAAALTRRLAAHDRAPSPASGDRAEKRVAADVKERLASLGYVAGPERTDRAGERDPKDYIDAYNEIRAKELMRLWPP